MSEDAVTNASVRHVAHHRHLYDRHDLTPLHPTNKLDALIPARPIV